MPTFLTEYNDPEDQVLCAGPFIVAKDQAEAETIAKALIMSPDGCPVRVLGELGESIPMNMDIQALNMLRQQVKQEVDAICRAPRKLPAGTEDAEWKATWDDDP